MGKAKNGISTSSYLSFDLRRLVKKPGAGYAAGITACLSRYFELLAPTIARLEKEFSEEIPALTNLAPVSSWRERGVRSVVLDFVRDTPADDLGPLDKEGLTARLEELTVLESYALAEIIERRAK